MKFTGTSRYITTRDKAMVDAVLPRSRPPVRRVFLPRDFLFGAALLLAACASPPVAEIAPSPDAVALTFGRCDAAANGCPRSADPKAAGDAEMQSALRECLGQNLGRPVYYLADAPIPPGYWLDVSVRPRATSAGDGRIMIDFRLLREARKESMAGFRYVLPADAASYREVCRTFSEYVRPKLQ